MDIWTWFRSHTKSFIYCVWFENGIMLCIIVNTACLAIDSPGLSKEVKIVLTNINDVSNILKQSLYTAHNYFLYIVITYCQFSLIQLCFYKSINWGEDL